MTIEEPTQWATAGSATTQRAARDWPGYTLSPTA